MDDRAARWWDTPGGPRATRATSTARARALPNLRGITMTLTLWIVSGLLALVYLASGAQKAIGRPLAPAPADAISPQELSAPALRVVGVLEILGAIALVVPWLTGVAPVLTPLAAVALALLQVFAIRFHLSRGERQPLPVNTVLLLLAALVAVLRFAGLG